MAALGSHRCYGESLISCSSMPRMCTRIQRGVCESSTSATDHFLHLAVVGAVLGGQPDAAMVREAQCGERAKVDRPVPRGSRLAAEGKRQTLHSLLHLSDFLIHFAPCTTAPQCSNGAVAASVAVCRKGICTICPKLCTPGAQVPAPSLFSDATKSLSIVVPAFNEEQRIAPMLDEALG